MQTRIEARSAPFPDSFARKDHQIMRSRPTRRRKPNRPRICAAAPLALAISLASCTVQSPEESAHNAGRADVSATVTSTHQEQIAQPTIQASQDVVAVPQPSSPRMETEAHAAVKHRQLRSHPLSQPLDLYSGYSVQPTFAGERYPEINDNGIQIAATDPVSTFSVDVDTAAYANARRQLNNGQLPHMDAVRVEEFINYFNYNYPQPEAGQPFSITTEVAPSPWNADRKLLLVGLQGYEQEREALPAANLVFLIDVSGSMKQPNKLDLLKSSMKLLARKLRPQDTISIAVYAGAAGTVLEPTNGNEQRKIVQAIEQLNAGGSTNGAAGIELAYSLAQQAFKEDGINRVMLATDGDFNVGAKSTKALGQLIEAKRRSGIALTVLGFGAGNYNDTLMQELAQKGNGNAAYIDSIHEARKVLIDEMGSTLETIAQDVKIQLEFNPAVVREYRLIGYETRALNREDFNNDKVDAGEIGAGHSVTALYELTLTDATRPSIDDLRYGESTGAPTKDAQLQGELAHIKLRYKAPGGDRSKLVSRVIRASEIEPRLANTSENFRFAASVSGFGQLLRNSQYLTEFTYADLLVLARGARGSDPYGYRSEFEKLLRSAAELQDVPATSNPVSMR